jgi:predicted O-methyltransferase YrrM
LVLIFLCKITLSNIDCGEGVFLFQNNSLEILPQVVEQGMRFNVVLIDGDHNYYTVRRELDYIDKLLKPGGVVIVDDYSGRWAERDLFYAEREGYENVKGVTAVDEFLSVNPRWVSSQPVGGEPIVLMRKET